MAGEPVPAAPPARSRVGGCCGAAVGDVEFCAGGVGADAVGDEDVGPRDHGDEAVGLGGEAPDGVGELGGDFAAGE